ncbi:galactose-1-epimerase [Glaesserella parasuis]|uniref:Aldose 1-epimerase n=1 Tax=Glaesserella parasuis serovar 5 (strain SH0165) TaxID=557723 RepID=B8F7C6_GLAP5|nr:galactose-1-epimerase [Glaesserella parasuis]ACL33228.1 aldose 1-epimerase [Glaesserella parasuis SH0165]EMY46256.1 aldose 1-epimerase [Glaesserella parasuis gx033]MDG6247913.1 galactose-1-epimerase [Glaesserella parasuis]MDG6268374.1 galactose-1-epimerase [Glaesserella parasuis]MDG6285215.1 galactose-1-epimerase [Glaesserella parasuis]
MKIYTLENDHLKITLSDFGASWLSCVVKLPNEQREVLVTTTSERWQEQSAYFGATVGRYANRIANGTFELNGQKFILAKNNGENNLHGGEIGADKCVWQVQSADEQAVTFHKIFANGEEGFGGEVTATIVYRLNGNQLEIEFNAVSSQDTPLCFTNHAYFNLSNEPTIHQHSLQLNAEKYLPVGANGIPNAPLKAVEGTSFDFRTAKMIGQDLLADTDQQAVKGYDHAFLLAKSCQDLTACQADAVLTYDNLRLELRTSKPALQVYTGNWLGGQPNLTGGSYPDYAGVALEPEFFPDTPNHPEWWYYGGISKANEPYQHYIHYRFIVGE